VVELKADHHIAVMRMAHVSIADFKTSIADKTPPCGLSHALTALWWAGKDDWDKSHRIVMDNAGADCAWVHAYLHRVEGDLGNAGYWYRQAGRKPATGELAAEWEAITAALLSEPS
jgi:hypothetical protein